MGIFYSSSARAFFSNDLHGDAIPSDAVPITADLYRGLLDGQSKGAAIVAARDGRPRLRWPRMSMDERRAGLIRAVKREASRRIDAIAPVWRQLNDQRVPSEDGAARFAAIDAVRAASGSIEAEVASAPDDALAAFDIAVHPAWPKE